MTGRKTKSKYLGLRQNVLLPIYHISYQPFFPRGSKKEIRDENGNLEFNGLRSRIHTNTFYYQGENKINHIPLFVLEDEIDITIKNLHNNGVKATTINQQSISLPTICPSCEHTGSATTALDKRYKTENHFVRIWFNHSKTKPKRCFVATFDAKNGGMKPRDGIDIRKFFTTYYLKKGQSLEFDIDKKTGEIIHKNLDYLSVN